MYTHQTNIRITRTKVITISIKITRAINSYIIETIRGIITIRPNITSVRRRPKINLFCKSVLKMF